MSYEESFESQNKILADRFAGVNRYLEQLADKKDIQRTNHWAMLDGISLDEYAARIEPFRTRVKGMFGYPPPGTPVAPEPSFEHIGDDDDGIFYRVKMPLLEEGLEAYGLLIRPSRPQPGKSLAVALHGGAGTPEIAAGILGASNYHDMGRRMARRGHVVWMPACHERVSFNDDAQLEDLHTFLDLKARLVGSTLPAIDLYSIIRSTEVLLSAEYSASSCAIVVGLSYGGFRALAVSALSNIFSACVSSCFFNDRRKILETHAPKRGFTDWFFNDVLAIATDVELCRLICPRPLFIEVGANDALFPKEGAIDAAAAVQQIYDSLGIGDRFGFDAFDGTHEYSGVMALEFLDRLKL